jgi:hypothetical protein
VRLPIFNNVWLWAVPPQKLNSRVFWASRLSKFSSITDGLELIFPAGIHEFPGHVQRSRRSSRGQLRPDADDTYHLDNPAMLHFLALPHATQARIQARTLWRLLFLLFELFLGRGRRSTHRHMYRWSPSIPTQAGKGAAFRTWGQCNTCSKE